MPTDKNFKCKYCGKNFMYEKPLENHMRLFHSPDMLDPVTGGFQCKGEFYYALCSRNFQNVKL